MVDHTLLRPESTAQDVTALCREAEELAVWSVCVTSTRVAQAARELADSPVRVTSVIGFPSGAHPSAIKAAEADRARANGADELDMVIDLGLAKDGRWDAVEQDIARVAEASGGATLKVIIEAAVLTPREILAACTAARSAGAAYVKTSTGFHPAGGASPEAVCAMARAVEGALGVKASGGIRDAHTAQAMIQAGATRLGLSGTRTVVEGFPLRGSP